MIKIIIYTKWLYGGDNSGISTMWIISMMGLDYHIYLVFTYVV